MNALLEKSASLALACLPQHLLTAFVHRLMRVRVRWIKNLQIRLIARLAGVNWDEAQSQDLDDYPHFNAFFTRQLRPDARVFDPAADSLCCPCDGRVSEHGQLDGDRIFQAKGRHFSLQALLAGDPQSQAWENGHFFTLYLSPRDYHRVHMPLDGSLQRMTYVPGRLFSVAPYTVRQVDRLFARNERVISIFETEVGPMALVLVGAMLVAGMETTWAGEVTPARQRTIHTMDYRSQGIRLAKGEEMGRFNMGSTVILLLPPGAVRYPPALRAGQAVRLGQELATLALPDRGFNGGSPP
jgi:phosphatidylserine decarboxylase